MVQKKTNKERCQVSANTLVKPIKQWLLVILTSIVFVTVAAACSNQSKSQQSPDKTLFEVSGNVKQITDIKNPVLPIHTHAGEVIQFTEDGKWNNYSNISDGEYQVTIRRNEKDQIIKIDGTNLDYSWSVGYEWDGNNVSKEFFSGLEEGSSTILTYEKGKLKSISLEANSIDIDGKMVFTYTLIDEKVDNEGNWIERNWQKKMETYSFHADINGYISTPDFATTEEITETRTISYYE